MSRTASPARDTGPRGKLSVIATPIGNLEDITLRALRVLKEAQLILAEDTRHTRGLLRHYDIHTPLRALHAHSSAHVIDQCVQELGAGAHMALVTDAGTPLVSDPGSALVMAAAQQEITIEAIPGPSAVIAALTVSAIACDGFRFFGFIPRDGKARRRVLAQIAGNTAASVLFESPQRLTDTLDDLIDTLGPTRSAAVCRELTKLHEEVARGDLASLRAHFAEGARGEITLVVAGDAGAEPTLIDPETHARELLAAGMSVRDAARKLAQDANLPKREAYALVQGLAASSDQDTE